MKALHIHMYKSLSYRLLSICTTFIISYLLTGNLTIAGSIASIDALIKLILYFFHERAWAKALKLLKTKRGKKILYFFHKRSWDKMLKLLKKKRGKKRKQSKA